MKKFSLLPAWQFIKSLLAGGVATLIDLTTLTILVEICGVSPAYANVPALLAGALAQFLGARFFVFEATRSPIGPQLAGFALVELGTLVLNAITFYAAISYTRIPYPIARLLCQSIVYVSFSYPLWTRIFKNHEAAKDRESGAC